MLRLCPLAGLEETRCATSQACCNPVQLTVNSSLRLLCKLTNAAIWTAHPVLALPCRLQLRQPELGTPRDRGDNRTEEIFAWWHPHRELPKQRYTHKDLLVAIPSSHSRLDLVLASR